MYDQLHIAEHTVVLHNTFTDYRELHINVSAYRFAEAAHYQQITCVVILCFMCREIQYPRCKRRTLDQATVVVNASLFTSGVFCCEQGTGCSAHSNVGTEL